MTVKELMALLRKYDVNTRVVVQGYEGGLADVDFIEPVLIKLNVNTESYYGPHEQVANKKEADESALAVVRKERE